MLDAILERVRGSRKHFVVYADGDSNEDAADDWAAVTDLFGDHDVHVEYRELPSGAMEPFLVVEDDGEFAGAIGLRELASLFEPPIVRPEPGDCVSRGYRVLFDLLDETVFAALDRRELLAVSREIEERASRVGDGVLRVGFQTLAKYEAQVETYEAIASETDVDVHVYGDRNWEPPEIPGVTYHAYSAASGERFWVLAFESSSSPRQTCALVAKERSAESRGDERPGRYDGFWTDDPALTREVLGVLESA